LRIKKQDVSEFSNCSFTVVIPRAVPWVLVTVHAIRKGKGGNIVTRAIELLKSRISVEY
jgi:hypothetical protein